MLVHLSTCQPVYQGQPVNLSSWFDRSLWVSRACSPFDLSTCLPGFTGKEVNIGVQGTGHYWYFVLVHLSTRVDRSRGKYRSAGHYGYLVLVDLSTCLPYYIEALWVIRSCSYANLSTRVDRSRGSYRSA